MGLMRMAGDVWNSLEDFGEGVTNTIQENGGFDFDVIDAGKPDDYGLRGNKPNYPMGSKGSNTMVKGGILGAVAGPVLNDLAETHVKPVAESYGAWWGNNVKSGLQGVETALTKPPAPQLPPPQVPEPPKPAIRMSRPMIGMMGI